MKDFKLVIAELLEKDKLTAEDKAFLKARASYLTKEQLKKLDLKAPKDAPEAPASNPSDPETEEEVEVEEEVEIDLDSLDEAGLRKLAEEQEIKLGNAKDVEKIREKIATALA